MASLVLHVRLCKTVMLPMININIATSVFQNPWKGFSMIKNQGGASFIWIYLLWCSRTKLVGLQSSTTEYSFHALLTPGVG